MTQIGNAHRDDGKRLIVRADELLTAFLELERAICVGLRLNKLKSYRRGGGVGRGRGVGVHLPVHGVGVGAQ